jgi:hypothetical protein
MPEEGSPVRKTYPGSTDESNETLGPHDPHSLDKDMALTSWSSGRRRSTSTGLLQGSCFRLIRFTRGQVPSEGTPR